MALDVINAVEVIGIMENYIARARPPKEIRDQLDINYRIDNQSIILFEVRPAWNNKTTYATHDFAKTTFNKKNNVWKIYWQRADLKWYLYEPKPEVEKLIDFLFEIDQYKCGCFKG